MAQRRRGAVGDAERVLQEAALKGEAAICVARSLFCAAVVIRFLALGGASSLPRALAELGPATVAIAFSSLVLRRYAAGTLTVGIIVPSVVVDAVVCFAMLLTNVLWPGSHYRGILIGPDINAVLVIVLASGFRLSVGVASLSGALNGASVIALTALDHTVGIVTPEYEVVDAALWLILVMGATGLAVVIAWWTRELAHAGAQEAIRGEQARRSLEALLHGHHDAHSLVSSLLLTTDMMASEVARGTKLDRLTGHLRGDLSVLRDCVQYLRHTAEGELTFSLEPAEVDVGHEVEEAAQRARILLRNVKLTVRTPPTPTRAVVAGGGAGVSRILLNLLTNAEKGDGGHGATAVHVDVCEKDGEVVLAVEDDGPGMQDVSPGVGLSILEGIVRASGGHAAFGTSELGGARAEIGFPALCTDTPRA